MRILRIMGATLVLAGIMVVGTQFRFRGAPDVLLPVVHAQSGCSNSSLQGNYGFQISGTIVGLGPIRGVALLTFDGAGNFTQIDNVSVNGFPILNRPGSGTYSVNADCTGTQILNLPGGQVVHTTFVIAGNGKQVFDVVTDSHVVITGVGKPVALANDNENDDFSPLACSLQTIKGSYGISTTGSIVSAGPVGPVGDVGVITFDGNGGASQTTTVSLNGVIIPNRSTLAGSYVVNADCTGDISMTLPTPTGSTLSTSHFVIVHNGAELLTIHTGVGRVLSGNAKKQHPRFW